MTYFSLSTRHPCHRIACIAACTSAVSPGFRRALLSVSNACCRPARLRASLLRFQPERRPARHPRPRHRCQEIPWRIGVLITGCIMTHVHRSERKPTAAPAPAGGACRCPGKKQSVACKPSLCFRTEIAGFAAVVQLASSNGLNHRHQELSARKHKVWRVLRNRSQQQTLGESRGRQ